MVDKKEGMTYSAPAQIISDVTLINERTKEWSKMRGVAPRHAKICCAVGDIGGFFNNAGRRTGVRNLTQWARDDIAKGLDVALIEKVPPAVKRRFATHNRRDAEIFRTGRRNLAERQKQQRITFSRGPKDPQRFWNIRLRDVLKSLTTDMEHGYVLQGTPSEMKTWKQEVGAPQGSPHGKPVSGTSVHEFDEKAKLLLTKQIMRKRYEDDTLTVWNGAASVETIDSLMQEDCYGPNLKFEVEGRISWADKKVLLFVGILLSVRRGLITAVTVANKAINLCPAYSYMRRDVKIGTVVGLMKMIICGTNKEAIREGLLFRALIDLLTKLKALHYEKRDAVAAYKKTRGDFGEPAIIISIEQAIRRGPYGSQEYEWSIDKTKVTEYEDGRIGTESGPEWSPVTNRADET